MGVDEEEVKRLRAAHVSVPDIARQTGLSAFEIYEICEGRDVAVQKMARLHHLRGTGWPWDLMARDPAVQNQPTGDQAMDAARAIIDLLRGTSLDNPVRIALDRLPEGDRKQILDIMIHLIRQKA